MLSTYNLQKVWSLIDLRHFLSFLDLQQCCCTLGPNKRKLVQMRKICSVSAFFKKVFFFVVLHCLGESMGFFSIQQEPNMFCDFAKKCDVLHVKKPVLKREFHAFLKYLSLQEKWWDKQPPKKPSSLNTNQLCTSFFCMCAIRNNVLKIKRTV